MEPIKNDNRKDDLVERLGKTQKRVVKSLFNNMALIIGMFIILIETIILLVEEIVTMMKFIYVIIMQRIYI